MRHRTSSSSYFVIFRHTVIIQKAYTPPPIHPRKKAPARAYNPGRRSSHPPVTDGRHISQYYCSNSPEAISCSRTLRRSTLPSIERGKSSTTTMRRGTL